MKFSPKVEACRVLSGPFGTPHNVEWGAFFIDGPCGQRLKIIASSENLDIDLHWEHVSVSCRNRCPNWLEMCFVKDLFWDEEETVMQLHPPRSKWINNHPFRLHLWAPTNQEIPMPPEITVGIRKGHEAEDVAKLAGLIDGEVLSVTP